MIEAWKENSRSATLYKTLNEPEEMIFESTSLAEEHFRKNYLEKEIRSASSFEVPGLVSRDLPDRRLGAAVRQAWENERKFPVGFANQLRRHFGDAGLQVFKHRKRVLFVSAIRPATFSDQQASLSESVATILKTIEKTPHCGRADLAAVALEGKPEEDHARIKTSLASDLHWLIRSGHVIEFHDGSLDLPAPPRPANEPREETTVASKTDGSEIPVSPEDKVPASEEPEAAKAPVDALPAKEPDAVEPLA